MTVLIATSCQVRDEKDRSLQEVVPLEGTWELISETKIEKDDTTFTPATKDQRMIKIINATHFAFLRHDLLQGKDSAAMFVAGGGRYTLQDRSYQEFLEYCNFREWENHEFKFTITIHQDTLIQQGSEKVEGLGIDRIIIEKYKRVTQ
ncbi:MAG: hypothetical protein ACOYXT_08165 [Bacteroidota bacterium]